MSDFSSMLESDIDFCFLDWGMDITLRSVVQTFDPETQQVNEVYTDYPARAISGFSKGKHSPGTAGQHRSEQVVYFVRSKEYPFGKTVNNSRVVSGGVEYEIEDVQVSATDLMLLECRRREVI